MDTKYDHTKHEKRIYKMWEDGGFFKAKTDNSKKPYTIVLPPPNANGLLHVGNALMIAIEDLLIRRKRMQGFSALWLPGTDHAGFETQVVFEKELNKKGQSRLEFDRNTLYKMIWNFVQKQSGIIDKQIRSLGPSLDWSRNTFTLDKHVIKTVYATFSKMVADGLIYRSNYMVNYCTFHGTTLSDLESLHKEKISPLYYVRYKYTKQKGYLVVATTRPEPIFVDTHLAVNPNDKKNIHLVGTKVLNPLTNKEMEIIADEFVDPKFGTGIVKLTPAHDKTDFAVAKKLGLPIVPAIGLDGKMLANGGELAGLYVNKARICAVEILKQKELIEKIDNNYKNSVAVCYKCERNIEPMVLPNWFMRVDKLKTKAHEAVKQGKVKIYPKWQEINFHRWMEEMHDWPISRQIVWGIRIPAWYDVYQNPTINVTFINSKKEVVAGPVGELLKTYSFTEIENGLQSLSAANDAEFIASDKKPNGDYLQETDTFDTWFSSSHWPLVTLKYPDSPDFKYFYPTSVLETGWEILRFWVSRMIMFGIYLTSVPPFGAVYLHGLVRAKDGRKMSKSLGNQIDPLDYVRQYGADALRIGLISGTANGKDFNFPHDKVLAYRNFTNKLWNMVRFVNLMFADCKKDIPSYNKTLGTILTTADKKILEKLESLIKKVDINIEKYRFAQSADSIYHFMWNDVADDYIEQVKGREDKEIALSVLKHVLTTGIKLLHPFMPFITEVLWENIPGVDEKPLMTASWPKT